MLLNRKENRERFVPTNDLRAIKWCCMSAKTHNADGSILGVGESRKGLFRVLERQNAREFFPDQRHSFAIE